MNINGKSLLKVIQIKWRIDLVKNFLIPVQEDARRAGPIKHDGLCEWEQKTLTEMDIVKLSKTSKYKAKLVGSWKAQVKI